MKTKIKMMLFIRGFTLLELLVVIAVITLLGTLAFVSVGVVREKARNAHRVASLNQLGKAIELYRDNNGGVPPGEDGVEYVNGNPEWIPGLVPKYMNALPSDPLNNGAHKFHYARQGYNYEVVSLLEENGNDAADTDGGSSIEYYEKTSGAFLEISNPGASGWHFTSSTEIVFMTCPTPGEQVTICHRPNGNTNEGNTLTVSCNAIGPEGHSNHEYDTLGTCDAEATNSTTQTITATAGIGGTISPVGQAEVVNGANTSFVITPDVGYEISSVTVDGADQGAIASYTFTNVQASHTINATFSAFVAECPVTLSPNLATYTSGTPIQITWDKTCYPSTQVMLEIRKMTESGSASFIMIYSSAPNTGTYSYQGFPSGTVGSEHWVVRVTNYDVRIILNESAQFMVTAATPVSYAITASAGAGGTISPSESVSVAEGSDKTFTITPSAGYDIAGVTVDGADQGAIASYTFTNVQASHTINATFSLTPVTPSYHSFSITSGPNGTITSSSTSVTRGGSMTFHITPNSGYQVASFTIDGVNAGTPTTYTFTNVTADHAINATFSAVAVECPVTLTPALATYTSGTPFQITWDKTCYPSSRVLLEIRKVATGGSTPFIMIYSSASNTGTYSDPYGFPTGTIGFEHWVIRVTNDNPRTILNESAQFMVSAP